MIVLRSTPSLVGVVIIIGGALLVYALYVVGSVLFTYPVDLYGAIYPHLERSAYEDVDHTLEITERVVGAAADNNAGMLRRDLLNGVELREKQRVVKRNSALTVGR